MKVKDFHMAGIKKLVDLIRVSGIGVSDSETPCKDIFDDYAPDELITSEYLGGSVVAPQGHFRRAPAW